MRETTRMAARAAVAAALSLAVGHALSVPRAYWGVLVAVVLVNETWGESIRMAVERLGMTAAGCLVGALLHGIASGHPRVEWALLVVCVFFAVYFRKVPAGGSYPWMIFFVTVYVVFLFAVVGAERLGALLLVRVYATALGCATALLASLIIRPRAAGQQLEDELRALQGACRALIEASSDDAAAATGLLQRVAALRARLGSSAYESVLASSRRHVEARVLAVEGLGHVSISLARTLAQARRRALPPPLQAVIDAARERVLADLDARTAPSAPRLAPCGTIDRADFAQVGAVLALAEAVCESLAALRRA